MFTVTFYSFKGGVGRTLALMNVASELAKTGNNVVVLDFDLEAPGLNTFDCFDERVPKFGLMDFITHYSDSYNDQPKIPDLKHYIEKSKKNSFNNFNESRDRFVSSTRIGDVWLMPARGTNSSTELSQIRFRELYEKKDGYLLFEELKLRIKKHTGADYLLIDSRTGNADHSYICTNQLADALVVVFFPNIQNQIGVEDIIGKVRTFEQVSNERILFVASRLPTGDDENLILEHNMKRFANKLKVDEKSIIRLYHNASFELLDQQLFSQAKTRTTQLYRNYEELTDQIECLNENSRRGVILNLRGNIFNERYMPPQISRLPRSKSLRRGKRPGAISYDAELMFNKAAFNFIDDLAVNWELHRVYRRRAVPGARRISAGNKALLFGITSFLLAMDSSKITGLRGDPRNPTSLLPLLEASGLRNESLKSTNLGQLWLDCHDFKAHSSVLAAVTDNYPYNQRVNDCLPQAETPLDEIINLVIDGARKYNPPPNEDMEHGPFEDYQSLSIVFFGRRNERRHKGVAQKVLEWNDYELDVLVNCRQELVWSAFEDFASSRFMSSNTDQEACDRIRFALNNLFNDFSTAREWQAHKPIFSIIGTEQFATWSPKSIEEFFKREIRHPNRFFKFYLSSLLSILSKSSTPDVEYLHALERELQQTKDKSPNKVAALALVDSLLAKTKMPEEEEGYVVGERTRLLKTMIAQLQVDKRAAQLNEDMVFNLQHQLKKLEEELDDFRSKTNKIEKANTLEYYQMQEKQVALAEEVESLRMEVARLRDLKSTRNDPTAVFRQSHYFSFLQFRNIPAEELLSEMENIVFGDSKELEKKIMFNLFNKNNNKKSY